MATMSTVKHGPLRLENGIRLRMGLGMGLPLVTALWDGVTVPFFALSIPKVIFQPLMLGKI